MQMFVCLSRELRDQNYVPSQEPCGKAVWCFWIALGYVETLWPRHCSPKAVVSGANRRDHIPLGAGMLQPQYLFAAGARGFTVVGLESLLWRALPDTLSTLNM